MSAMIDKELERNMITAEQANFLAGDAQQKIIIDILKTIKARANKGAFSCTYDIESETHGAIQEYLESLGYHVTSKVKERINTLNIIWC